MLSRMKEEFGGVVLVAALAAAVIVAGCGGGEERDTGYHRVVKKETKPSLPPQTQPPAAADDEPAPAEVAENVDDAGYSSKEVTYEEAEAAYMAHRYGEAVKMFTAYTKRRDENHWGWYMLGLSARKAGNLELAAESLERSLALAPKHVKSMINLARVELDAGDPGGALETLDEALAADPGSSVACRLRGVALGELGRTDEAERAYREAIAKDPRDAWAMNNLGHLLIGRGDFEGALPPLAMATRIDTTVAVFWNNLGMALERTGRFYAAAKAYDSALNADDGYEKAYANWTRVQDVREQPGIEQVDLAVAADSFMKEMEEWKLASARPADEGAPAADSLVADVTAVIPADSVSAGPSD